MKFICLSWVLVENLIVCFFHSSQNLLARENRNPFFIFCYGDEKTKIGPKVLIACGGVQILPTSNKRQLCTYDWGHFWVLYTPLKLNSVEKLPNPNISSIHVFGATSRFGSVFNSRFVCVGHLCWSKDLWLDENHHEKSQFGSNTSSMDHRIRWVFSPGTPERSVGSANNGIPILESSFAGY